MLKMVGLEDKMDCYPWQLSEETTEGGVGSSHCKQASIINLREPPGNLDPNTSEHIMYLLDRINEVELPSLLPPRYEYGE